MRMPQIPVSGLDFWIYTQFSSGHFYRAESKMSSRGAGGDIVFDYNSL